MRLTRQIPNATAKAIAALLEPYAADVTPAAVRAAFGAPAGARRRRWVTTHEAAIRLCAPVRTVRYWATTGRLPARRIGTQWQVEIEIEEVAP